MFTKDQIKKYALELEANIKDIEKALFVSKLPDGLELDRPVVYLRLSDYNKEVANRILAYRAEIREKTKPLKNQLAGFLRLYTGKKARRGTQLMLGEVIKEREK